MTGVTRWTGQEVALLRKALRRTGRDFAALVGVSNRQLTTWESRGATIELRPGNQAALDTLLARAGPDAQNRFAALLTERAAAAEDQRTEELLRRDPRLFKHPLDGKVMARVEEGIFLSGPRNTPTWADSFLIDVHPVTNADYARFTRATGHRSPRHWPQGRGPEALRDHPVVWVDWNDAAA